MSMHIDDCRRCKYDDHNNPYGIDYCGVSGQMCIFQVETCSHYEANPTVAEGVFEGRAKARGGESVMKVASIVDVRDGRIVKRSEKMYLGLESASLGIKARCAAYEKNGWTLSEVFRPQKYALQTASEGYVRVLLLRKLTYMDGVNVKNAYIGVMEYEVE